MQVILKMGTQQVNLCATDIIPANRLEIVKHRTHIVPSVKVSCIFADGYSWVHDICCRQGEGINGHFSWLICPICDG